MLLSAKYKETTEFLSRFFELNRELKVIRQQEISAFFPFGRTHIKKNEHWIIIINWYWLRHLILSRTHPNVINANLCIFNLSTATGHNVNTETTRKKIVIYQLKTFYHNIGFNIESFSIAIKIPVWLWNVLSRLFNWLTVITIRTRNKNYYTLF